MKKDVLGIKIDDVSMSEALERVEGWLIPTSSRLRGTRHYIVTPNPEMIVLAQKDTVFKKILNDADLAIPDGVGLGLMGVKNRVSGTDLMEQLVKLASEKGWTIGLLGGREGVAEKTAEVLKKRYPGLVIASEASQSRLINQDSHVAYEHTRKSAGLSPLGMTNGVDILFVALGHGKQERWIVENLDNLPAGRQGIPVKVAMGVGGAFDYISGRVPRAPFVLRWVGLEWLFRLIVQPWRIRRQLNLIKYLWLVFTKR